MTLPSLLPLAGAAIAPMVARTLVGVAEGLSFLDALQTPEPEPLDDNLQAAEPHTLERDLAELADRLRNRFSQLGIDLTTPLRLKQDQRDRVVLDGDHPDRVLVESVFGNDDELTNLFNTIADSAASQRRETGSGVTREFRLVLGQMDAEIEFD